MTTENDQLLDDFSKDMKKNDQSRPVPEVDYLGVNRKRIRRTRKLLSIAASLILLLGTYWFVVQPEEPMTDKSITEIEQNIESMMSWKSATSDLIEY